MPPHYVICLRILFNLVIMDFPFSNVGLVDVLNIVSWQWRALSCRCSGSGGSSNSSGSGSGFGRNGWVSALGSHCCCWAWCTNSSYQLIFELQFYQILLICWHCWLRLSPSGYLMSLISLKQRDHVQLPWAVINCSLELQIHDLIVCMRHLRMVNGGRWG